MWMGGWESGWFFGANDIPTLPWLLARSKQPGPQDGGLRREVKSRSSSRKCCQSGSCVEAEVEGRGQSWRKDQTKDVYGIMELC